MSDWAATLQVSDESEGNLMKPAITLSVIALLPQMFSRLTGDQQLVALAMLCVTALLALAIVLSNVDQK
jgi:hypothetical protein